MAPLSGPVIVTTGGGLVTVTVKLQVDPSLAVQVTVVVPFGKLDPEGGAHVTGTALPQGSIALAEKFAAAVHWPGSVAITILAGQVIKVEGVPAGGYLIV